MRYTAHTIDGSLIFSADTMQRMADKIIDHREKGLKPYPAYCFDNAPGCAFPYVTFRKSGTGETIGTPHESFDLIL
jgi:hypothetical protein